MLWRGTTRQPRLGQQVLYVWQSVERFLPDRGKTLLKFLLVKNQFSRAILPDSFKILWILETYGYSNLENI